MAIGHWHLPRRGRAQRCRRLTDAQSGRVGPAATKSALRGLVRIKSLFRRDESRDAGGVHERDPRLVVSDDDTGRYERRNLMVASQAFCGRVDRIRWTGSPSSDVRS